MPNKWFGNVLKDVTVSFIANNPWMLYCEAPFDPELTPSTSTYGQGNDYFMQPSVRSFEMCIRDSGMVAAYTYGFPVAEEAFKNAKVTLVTLTNYEAVLDVALRTGYIEKEDIQTLNEWRKDPAHWDAGK